MAVGTRVRLPPREDEGAREAWIEDFERRIAPFASALGVLFVLVVIGENLAARDSALRGAFLVAGWAIWSVFVLEFVLRAIVAPSFGRFFRRNWWQLVFLALPFLRFVAALRLARVARAGRILGSALRGTRSAGQVLRTRIGWLATIHAIVVLSASQLLFEFGAPGGSYGEVLHGVALASTSGEPLGFDSGLSEVLDVALSLYSVAVFASAAGALGAYFIERRRADERPAASAPA
ncbi:MAG TPA: hypothetical protein VF044_01045 [Actinomycetota bacterium]